MQRSQPLIPFSHDHHHGLVVCRRIGEGVKHGIAPGRIIAYIREFWHKDLRRHFEEEEQSVFPLLPGTDGLIIQALEEHRQVRAYISLLFSDNHACLETAAAFGKLLQQHIRFEERVLFPHIEQSAPAAQLAGLNSQPLQAHKPLQWSDEFWNERHE